MSACQPAARKEGLASETLLLAFKIWSPTPFISESRGRKPKLAKYSRFPDRQAWRALVCATRLGVSGVRPDVHDVRGERPFCFQLACLDKNVYVAGFCRPGRELTESGDVRVRLTNDGVARRHVVAKTDRRVYVALEQLGLLSWTGRFLRKSVEKRWLSPSTTNVINSIFWHRASARA